MKRKGAKPFLKWAGGKTQLIPEIHKNLPHEFSKITTYIEPFVGSGAILFWILEKFPSIQRAVINDINPDLTSAYKTIAEHPKLLIELLLEMEQTYHALENEPELKKEYFYAKRQIYNQRAVDAVEQTALLLFLNKSCFNGLFRVNSKGAFNVPQGSYKKPTICDKENLWAVSSLLQKVEILDGDYRHTLEHADAHSFFYFDPPYKPLNKTSSFNSYAKSVFGDKEQLGLKKFCQEIDLKGHKFMLSNSDVKNHDAADDFFDELYTDFNIQRVKAKRSINSKGNSRGELNELLIRNYSN